MEGWMGGCIVLMIIFVVVDDDDDNTDGYDVDDETLLM